MIVKPAGYIPAGITLQYSISFENTGNALAHDIHIMDTLSDNIVLNSFRVVSSSAVMNTALFNDGAHNIAKFDFPHINLPDSSHHNQCTGMVIFTIKTKSGLPIGTTIFNHAGIFFEDNPVVMTNTVEDIIGTPSGVTHLATKPVEVYPNPATGQLTMSMAPGAFSSFTIANMLGEQVSHGQLAASLTTIDIKGLAPGMYYITFRGQGESAVLRFAKM
jgi:uncharacterized repeat protein (TIGR01451 family)